MIGAIEFLRKAKEVCNSRDNCNGCPAYGICEKILGYTTDESTIVAKVMSYQIKEDSNE